MPILRVHLAAAALLAVALGGCREPAAPSAQADGGSTQAPRRYTVRGEVVRLPEPGRSGSEMSIRHEAVPDFVDRAGHVVGMGSMVMPFRLDPPVLAGGIAVGDKVEMRFAVDWSRNAFWIERLDKLPADTPLRF